MAEYTPITQEEAEEFLLPQGFRKIDLAGTVELVYARRVDSGDLKLSLRVYTGINPSGTSRDVGEDAIRCVIAWQAPDETVKVVAGSKRVHRVKGWRKNLQDRLDTLKPGPRCECGSPMVERKGKSGKFYGCASFPVCRKTRPV